MKEVSFCTCNWANSCRCSWRSIKTTNLFLVNFLSLFGSHMDPKIVYFGVHMGSIWDPGTAKVVLLCDTSIKNCFWEGLRFRASISYAIRLLSWFLIDVSSEMLTFDPARDPKMVHFGVHMSSIWDPYGAQVSLGTIKRTPEERELNFGSLFGPKMDPQNGPFWEHFGDLFSNFEWVSANVR